MRTTLKLVPILILSSLLLNANQTAVTVECVSCSSSPFLNCKKITADGFSKTADIPCILGTKKTYRVSKCQTTRSCSTYVCYMEDYQCISNSSTCNPTTLDYKCGTCSKLSGCSYSCWSKGSVTTSLDQTCTNSCSDVTGVQQVDQACKGGVDGAGNKCSCCRRTTNVKPSVLGECSLGNSDFLDAEFVQWAILNAKDSGLTHLFSIASMMLLALLLLFSL